MTACVYQSFKSLLVFSKPYNNRSSKPQPKRGGFSQEQLSNITYAHLMQGLDRSYQNSGMWVKLTLFSLIT